MSIGLKEFAGENGTLFSQERIVRENLRECSVGKWITSRKRIAFESPPDPIPGETGNFTAKVPGWHPTST
jgi:hypothetical protein